MNADTVQPIVLVGGRSTRFGRDKLSEPVDGSGDEWLVDRPLAVLRAVFGRRVAAVGRCDAAVAARFDRVIEDRYPGAGPAGGITSVLESVSPDGAVFVLAGDMPRVSEASVRAILAASQSAPEEIQAVLASAEGAGAVEPCFGVYFAGAAGKLRPRAGTGKSPPLRETLAGLAIAKVRVPANEVGNVNRPEDLLR